MKKVKVLLVVLAVVLVSSFLAKESIAQTKWEVKSISGPASCQLNAKDLTFKVKIKNIGNAISTGDNVTVRVVITFDGNNLGGDELDFGQSAVSNIGIGKTTTLNVLCTNENFRQFTNVKGDKSISVTVSLAGDAGITKIFNIKVK